MRHRNIFLVGLMGSGKTTVGRHLSHLLGRPFADSDHEVERRAGADIAWIFEKEGETGFRDREAHVIDDLTQRPGIVLATGGGAVLRAENRRHLGSRGLVIYLHGSIEQLAARTGHDRRRPLLRDADPREVLRRLDAERDPLYREVAALVFETERRSARTLARQIADVVSSDVECNRDTLPPTLPPP